MKLKRKMATLTVLGTLVALAVPASSSAVMLPAGNQWEIAGGATPPRLGTSLGSCPVTKITGQVPAFPTNEEASLNLPITITYGTCTSGTTIEPGESRIAINSGSYRVTIGSKNRYMRFSSLPGCKLLVAGLQDGLWLNGFQTKASGYHAEKISNGGWFDDGSTCALSGKQEAVTWSSSPGFYNPVNNLSNPTAPILVG